MALRRRTYTLDIEDANGIPGSGGNTEVWGVTRPHLMTFLVFASGYFNNIFIWSAGQIRYVNDVVDFMFRDLDRPTAVYTHDDCDETKDGILTKPLQKMVDAYPGVNFENTLIVDDRVENFDRNPNNGILIPGYTPRVTIDGLTTDDTALLKLMHWLKQPSVANCSDVRKLNKKRIFE